MKRELDTNLIMQALALMQGFTTIPARAAPKTQGTGDSREVSSGSLVIKDFYLGGRESSSLSFTPNKYTTTKEQRRNWFSTGAGAVKCHIMPIRMSHAGMSQK